MPTLLCLSASIRWFFRELRPVAAPLPAIFYGPAIDTVRQRNRRWIRDGEQRGAPESAVRWGENQVGLIR